MRITLIFYRWNHMAYAGIMGCSSEGKKVPRVAMSVFGLGNEVMHHMLILHFFCLVCGME